jgi:DNA-binding transcriptional MerR regulator
MRLSAPPGLRIGQVAAATGLTIDTIRYYERLGLVPHPPRTAGGFRTYGSAALDRLRTIQQIQRLGLTLREIRQLVEPSAGSGRAHCRGVRDVLGRRLEDLDQRISELQTLRGTLREALTECDRALEAPEVSVCPVVSGACQAVGF